MTAKTKDVALGRPAGVLITLWLAAGGLSLAADPPGLLPQPKSLVAGQGVLVVPATAKVVAWSPALEPLAGVMADDIGRLHGVKLGTGKGTAAPGDVVLRLRAGTPKPADDALGGADAYRLSIDQGVVVEGATYQAVAMGMMTVLQAARTDRGALTFPRMTVVDSGDRALRALQVSIRGGYHPPAWVKKVIDLARFYKVRVLQLHTTEALWVGSVMDSSNGVDPKLLKEHSAWSKKEMEDVIAYATVRGVSLIPHNEMRPNDPFWPPVLTKDFNPSDKYAGYVDEVDGQGVYQIKGNLADDPRWWNFLKVVSQKSRDQFAKSWPGGKLPYYHIGPVYGEGGCNGKEAIRMLEIIKDGHPGIKMMYWNGPGNADPDITPHKDEVVVDFYSSTWGGTPDGLLAAGYALNNTSWTPLYIQPGSRVKARRQGQWIFDEFHISRFGREGPFGEPLASHVHDCAKYEANIVGALLSTWDFAGPDQNEGHLEMITPCIPYFAEHIWNIQPWPYPAGAWQKASAIGQRLAPLANRFLRENRPPGVPTAQTATEGVHADAVEILWADSDNQPEFYQVYRGESEDPAQAAPVSPLIPAADVTQLNVYRDTRVAAGRSYYYWVRGVNSLGASEFGKPVKGAPGDGLAMPAAYEGFDYAAGAGAGGLAGGTGFKTPWKVEESNAPLVVSAAGLTYPGLKTGGRALHVEATDADETNRRRPPHVNIVRTLQQGYGKNGTQVWSAFLIRGHRCEIGSIDVNIGRTSIGKGWGNSITIYDAGGGGVMEPNKTYLIVTRYTFHAGNDLMHLWVNPVPGKVPADTEAMIITRKFDNPEADTLHIRMQPYGKGSYDVDEIRVGKSYAEVTPQ